LLSYTKERLEATNEEKFNSWLNYDIKHYNSLDMQNPVVKKVFDKFQDKDTFTLYSYLRIYYWTRFDTLEEFENDMNEKLNSLNNIRDLFKT
jgi:hypothetical protein